MCERWLSPTSDSRSLKVVFTSEVARDDMGSVVRPDDEPPPLLRPPPSPPPDRRFGLAGACDEEPPRGESALSVRMPDLIHHSTISAVVQSGRRETLAGWNDSGTCARAV